MKNITLITNTQIISKIFKLVSNKLNLSCTTMSDDSNLTPTDILIFDDDCFHHDEMIRYKSLCSTIVVLGIENKYEYSSCTIIKKPFLPSVLQKELDNIISAKPTPNIETIEYSHENIDDLVDFIDTIDENIQNEDENDIEINITQDKLARGGVLDKEELNILHDMINDSNEEIIIDEPKDNNWEELSDIIDQTIDDIQEENSSNNNELTLILNNYSIEELSPLLNKLNQNSIDKLSAGEELVVKMKVING
jgi:hypothetical protein